MKCLLISKRVLNVKMIIDHTYSSLAKMASHGHGVNTLHLISLHAQRRTNILLTKPILTKSDYNSLIIWSFAKTSLVF